MFKFSHENGLFKGNTVGAYVVIRTVDVDSCPFVIVSGACKSCAIYDRTVPVVTYLGGCANVKLNGNNVNCSVRVGKAICYGRLGLRNVSTAYVALFVTVLILVLRANGRLGLLNVGTANVALFVAVLILVLRANGRLGLRNVGTAYVALFVTVLILVLCASRRLGLRNVGTANVAFFVRVSIDMLCAVIAATGVAGKKCYREDNDKAENYDDSDFKNFIHKKYSFR